MKSYSNPLAIVQGDSKYISTLTARSEIMIALTDIIEARGWTQTEAAEKFGVSQPRISNLVNGKIDKFSLGMLIDLLSKIGYVFDFSYSPENPENPFSVSISGQVDAE